MSTQETNNTSNTTLSSAVSTMATNSTATSLTDLYYKYEVIDQAAVVAMPIFLTKPELATEFIAGLSNVFPMSAEEIEAYARLRSSAEFASKKSAAENKKTFLSGLLDAEIKALNQSQQGEIAALQKDQEQKLVDLSLQCANKGLTNTSMEYYEKEKLTSQYNAACVAMVAAHTIASQALSAKQNSYTYDLLSQLGELESQEQVAYYQYIKDAEEIARTIMYRSAEYQNETTTLKTDYQNTRQEILYKYQKYVNDLEQEWTQSNTTATANDIALQKAIATSDYLNTLSKADAMVVLLSETRIKAELGTYHDSVVSQQQARTS